MKKANSFRIRVLCALLLTGTVSVAQELYVYSDPASNLPARSVSVKLTDHAVLRDRIYGRFSNRLMPQVSLGLHRNWMLRLGGTIANMHTPDTRYESLSAYLKYRFFSRDEVHRHFRMAVFVEGSVTRAPFHYDEITLMGDKEGLSAGIIATQLRHKLAVSATVRHTQLLDPSRFNKVLYVPARNYQAMDYSLSAGYLLLPKAYSSYRQTNLNLYLELLAQQTLDRRTHYVDAAPALQWIFHSSTRLNMGWRTQLAGNMQRMTRNSWQLSVEHIFLQALAKKKRK